jgi:SAM-dependent methyltransferase
VLAAAGIESTHSVLDVGCGNGATTRAAARRGSEGNALGVDLSKGMVALATKLADEEGVENVRFEVADAQTRTFEPEFDRAISRFGVMFFDDPVAAFANIRSALRDGGRVTFAVWQELLANEWLTVPAAGVLQHVKMPELGEAGAPGPFSLGDPDRIRNIFTEAGFDDLGIEPFESPLLMGGRGDLDHAIAFLLRTGMARAMLEDAPPDVVTRATAAAREALEPYVTPDGVLIGGAAWIVSAAR